MKTVRIGLAGFGTVGGSVYRHLCREADLIAERCGVRPLITAIARRNPSRKRKGLPVALVVPQVLDLVSSNKTDIIVEAMGGCDSARKLVLAALKAGKPVVTANKALLAEHGPEVFGEANRRGVPIFFEASVAGGIPIIKSLREGLVANRFGLIYGIVNGTCNYILTRMSQEGLPFGEALQQAQALGYAEADPSFDVDGIDSAHKAAVLASLAHGGCIDFKKVHIQGIRNISTVDIQFAHRLGYEIKLLAIIRCTNRSEVEVRVHPTLIPKTNRLASIRGVTNAVVVRGHVVGDIEFSGPGAGGSATASAVLSDIVQAATHFVHSQHAKVSTAKTLWSKPVITSLAPKGPKVARMEGVISQYYLRLTVIDKPGVMAQITSILGKASIGISSIIQPEVREGASVPLIFMIHDARNDSMSAALRKIEQLSCVRAKPIMIRVETFES
jgi:homoserine dehydrogenase